MGKIGDSLKLYMAKVLMSWFGPNSTQKQAFLVLLIYVVLGSLIFSILPAIGFHYLEGWRFLDAWYFTIITLTTVGFGDYTPSFQEGDEHSSRLMHFFLEIYRTIVLIWMLAGLAWLGGLISMISESLGEILTTMRVGPIVVRPNTRVEDEEKHPSLHDIPEGMLKYQLYGCAKLL